MEEIDELMVWYIFQKPWFDWDDNVDDVDDACGGGDDDWYCNHSQWLIMKVVNLIVLVIVIMMEINIHINDNYGYK